MSYNSKYKGAEVDAALDLAKSALQEHQDISDLATKTELKGKVDKVDGKQLSTEDFTTLLKQKLDGLSNYNDTEISQAVSKLRTDLDTLVSGDTTTAIKSFNDIIAFLDGITDSEDLESIIASIEQQIAGKQSTISDLDTIRSGAAKGATALQSYTEKYTGTVTGIKMNGASKGTSGVIDLGTVITAHQDISGKLDKTTAASTYLSKTDASSTYLGKTAKATSAGTADSATKATQDASGNVITTTYATKTETANKQDKSIKFTNLSANNWVSDSTYADFPYRCDVTCQGVTGEMYADVVFNLAQSLSGSYAPVCETRTDAVSVWSSENISITIPTILITK